MNSKFQWTRTVEGLKTKSQFGTAQITKTPTIEGIFARPWTLDINNQLGVTGVPSQAR